MNNDSMKAGFLEDLEKAKQAQSTAKDTMTAAASKMFKFYLNLLSPESKYSWNKIVGEQTENDPYVNLQPLKNSGRNAIQYIISRIRYQYSENLVADEKVYVNSIPFIVMYTFLIHSRYSSYKTKKDTVNAILFIVTYTFPIQ